MPAVHTWVFTLVSPSDKELLQKCVAQANVPQCFLQCQEVENLVEWLR